MEENKKPLAYKHQTRKFLYHPVHHHWKSQHYFWGSHYENHGSLGELVDLEVQAEPKLRRAGVDLQRAVLQVVLFCKTSSFQPVLFISLPNMPSQSLIWGENKHSVFNSVNRFENVHGNWIFFLLTGSWCLLIQRRQCVSGRHQVGKKEVILEYRIFWGVKL